MRMVHTIRVYTYGMAVYTRMIWIFVPYAYSYTILLLFTSSIYIAITNTALLFVLDHTAFCSDALLLL